MWSFPDKQANNRDVVIAGVGLTPKRAIRYQGRIRGRAEFDGPPWIGWFTAHIATGDLSTAAAVNRIIPRLGTAQCWLPFVVQDMLRYDAELENEDPAAIRPFVVEWQAQEKAKCQPA